MYKVGTLHRLTSRSGVLVMMVSDLPDDGAMEPMMKAGFQHGIQSVVSELERLADSLPTLGVGNEPGDLARDAQAHFKAAALSAEIAKYTSVKRSLDEGMALIAAITAQIETPLAQSMADSMRMGRQLSL